MSTVGGDIYSETMKASRGRKRNGEEVYSLPSRLAVAASGAEPQLKMNLVKFECQKSDLVTRNSLNFLSQFYAV